ncbi:MAG: DEAD/DEAH box helicase [Spirochaetaceae bacterium]|jgi:ATP-dependent RNA helicase RhlB|nr:DEAD/DEAH box helicase [Spirochaetaceae bacterium]
MEFTALSLYPDLQRGISEAGYTVCTPVQEQVIRRGLDGSDLYVQSQTGTGKTAAFLIVILQRLLSDPLLKGRGALIIVPTRELAVQVEEEAKRLSAYLPYRTGSFYGGVGYTEQRTSLKEAATIMVGTPGRVLDLTHSGIMNLMNIAFLVLDEADRMFDMGFYPDLRRILAVVSPAAQRQTMLFSATLSISVKNLAWEYTKDPVEIAIEPETVTAQDAEQLLYHVHSDDKLRLLLGILAQEKPEHALIFCNTKRFTEFIARKLCANGYAADFLSGDLAQSKRLAIIDSIKSGKLRYLVATDVAARGLDIEDLELVINYDLPSEAASYVHRIGRTARAGKTGKAISFVSEQDVYDLPAIERFIEKKIPALVAHESLFVPDTASQRMRPQRRQEKPSLRKEQHRSRKEPAQRKSRSEEKPKERPKTVRTEQTRQTKEQNAARDLSKLSFEERMAYYRQKYARESLSQKSAPAQKEKKATRKPRHTSKTVPVSEPLPEPVPAPAPAPITPEPAKESAKQGIITRIFERFTVKKH